MVNAPAPVGGTVLPLDFGPSILFAVLYALLVPVTVYRMVARRSRTFLIFGTVSFSIERIVIFSLRAVQARSDSKRFSHGLNNYMQVSFGMGFIGIAGDLANILRCLLVNPTYGSDTFFQSPAASSKGSVVSTPSPGTPDQAELRAKIRSWTGFLSLAFLAATVPGIIGNSNYSSVFDDQQKADKTTTLRYVSVAVALGLTLVLYAVAFWGLKRLPRISRKGIFALGQMTALISVIALYRLAVMKHRVTSLASPDPLNSSGNKAAFYILHALPEWLITVVLVGYNLRKTFGTGPWGDYRWRDETEKEKQQRLEKEAKKREKARLSGRRVITQPELHDGQNIELQDKKQNSELVTAV